MRTPEDRDFVLAFVYEGSFGHRRQRLARQPPLHQPGEAVDGGDLTAFRFKTLPTQEFLVHEQAIEENLSTRRSRAFIPIFNATTD